MHHLSQKPRRGFTLIELLVVIAIIAILAAILFPVFQKVRENARRTSCASNEKQIGIAFTQYEQDADEQTPGSTQWGYGWAEKLQPFVKSAQVFQCPDDSHTVPTTAFAEAPAGVVPSKISYAINGNVRQCTTYTNNCNGAALSQFTAPANTVLVTECAIKADGAQNLSGNINDPSWDVNSKNTDHCSFIIFDTQNIYDGHPAVGDTYNGRKEPAFHDQDGGSLNYLAADGHVKYLKKTAVSGALPSPNGVAQTGDNGTVGANNMSPYAMTYSVTK